MCLDATGEALAFGLHPAGTRWRLGDSPRAKSTDMPMPGSTLLRAPSSAQLLPGGTATPDRDKCDAVLPCLLEDGGEGPTLHTPVRDYFFIPWSRPVTSH